MIALYQGRGGSFWPRSRPVDNLLTQALRRRGNLGNRVECTYASPEYEVALRYAANESPEHVYRVQALPGAIVSWAEKCQDAIVALQIWMRDEAWHSAPGSYNSLLRDIQGDIGTLETYLVRGLQTKNTRKIADSFIAGINVRGETLTETTTIGTSLADHRGEVWITGPCHLRPATN